MSILYAVTNLLASASSITPSGAAHSLFGVANLYDGIPGQPFKYAAAGPDDMITIDFGSPTAPTIVSINGHNFDSGMTVARLRASTDNFSGSDVWIADFTTNSPTMYVYGTGWGSYRYWRTVFKGTNGNPISLGEMWFASATALARNQRWGWGVEVIQPQNRQVAPSGQIYASKRTGQRHRRVTMQFDGLTEAQKDVIEEDINDATSFGVDPLLIVPDSSDDIVIHGRVEDTWFYSREEAKISGGRYVFGLSVLEDPFEAEYL